MASQQRQVAVVVGASMAGLSAATVLASRFGHVVVVDRDDISHRATGRRGVPQGRHAHGLLPSGHRRLEAWFPGLTEQLVSDGARLVDFSSEALWYQGERPRVRFRSGVDGPVCSRPLLEHHLRRRVLALPNVILRSGRGATGVTTSPDRRRVTGITLDDGSSLPADLVVDASGRGGRSVRWLSDLGYEEPPTSVVTIDVGYASRVFQRDPEVRYDWSLALIMSPPPSARMGVVFPLEGERWMVTLAGFHGDRPPREPSGFLAFARTLPSSVVAEVIESSPPLGDIVTHLLPSNLRRHVERLRRVPGGLVMLGDAICSFNPVYGQGMSSAVLQAEALDRTLDSVSSLDERFVRHFYRRAAKAVNPVWQLSTGADFALPATTGPKARGTDLINRYMAKVLLASQVSEEVCLRLLEVTSLLRPPGDLMTPAMVAKVRRVSRGMHSTPPLVEKDNVRAPVRGRQIPPSDAPESLAALAPECEATAGSHR